MRLAQFTPDTTLLLPVIASIKSDVVSWGVAFMGVALVIYAYHRIYALVQEREAQREEDEERDEQIDHYHPSSNYADPDDDYDFKIKE